METLPNDFFNVMRVAFLGKIYPNIRAIAFKYQPECLTLRYYFEREVTDFDKEQAEITATEIEAMMRLDKFEIEFIHSTEPSKNLDCLNGWLYFRYE